MPLGSNKSIPVNGSLICATNRNLRELIAKGAFREDLYYRLNGLVVRLPPLRERTDLEIVINKLLSAKFDGTPYTVSVEVMSLFKRHNWPGNFRQLTNLLRTAMAMTDEDHVVRLAHLPEDFLDDVDLAADKAVGSAGATAGSHAGSPARLEDVELLAIQRALQEHGGNVSAAARSAYRAIRSIANYSTDLSAPTRVLRRSRPEQSTRLPWCAFLLSPSVTERAA